MNTPIHRSKQIEAECERQQRDAYFSPCEITAFVQGASWWEHCKSGATMWQSDKEEAFAEAKRLALAGMLGKIA